MAEAFVKKNKFKEISTQTDELHFNLTVKKTARMYFSQSYKEPVLSLNFGTSKNFIITNQMWNILQAHTQKIEHVFNK